MMWTGNTYEAPSIAWREYLSPRWFGYRVKEFAAASKRLITGGPHALKSKFSFDADVDMMDVGKEVVIDIMQRARLIVKRKEILMLEEAYERAYLEAVKYRNLHPRETWTGTNRAEYNELLIAFDIAKTDLLQYATLRNANTHILY